MMIHRKTVISDEQFDNFISSPIDGIWLLAETNPWNYFLLKLECIRGMFWKIAGETNDVRCPPCPPPLLSRFSPARLSETQTCTQHPLLPRRSQLWVNKWVRALRQARASQGGVRCSELMSANLLSTFRQNSVTVRQRISSEFRANLLRFCETCLFTATNLRTNPHMRPLVFLSRKNTLFSLDKN